MHFVRKTKINTPKKIKQIDKKIRSLFYPIYSLIFLSLTTYYGYIEFKKGVNIREAKAVVGELKIDTSSSTQTQRFNKMSIGNISNCTGELCVSGNVGVGNTSPTKKIEVSFTDNNIPTDPGNYEGLLIDNTSTVANTGSAIHLQSRYGGGARGGMILKSADTSGYADLSLYTEGPDGTRVEDLTIKNRNVGIGTTAPNYKLTIAGGGNIFGVDNTASFAARNTSGTYEAFLWPRWSDNIMYLNYGSGGFNIRNNSSTSTIFMTNDNKVGIGTTNPTYKFQVAGSLYVSGSSRRFKENIKPLDIDTSKIYKLEPVSFDYKEKYKDFGKKIGGTHQIGLIAEDVYDIIPELAVYDNNTISNVDYEKLPVLMLKEVQRHEEKIKKLEEENKLLQKRIEQLEVLLKIK